MTQGTIKVQAYAAMKQGEQLTPYEFDMPAPVEDKVRIKVEYCGVCHSDVSMAKNEWQITQYPIVPGHEIIGIVESVGPSVRSIQVGTRVGLGWHAGYCGTCNSCRCGDQNLCGAAQPTLMGQTGGFAQFVMAREAAVIPVPKDCNPATAGPLFCGGVTVFTPLLEYGIQATDHVGVIGIGGLGHMALRFLKAMGCEVTAFSSNVSKADFAKDLGATHVVDSTKPEELAKLTGQFKMILVTANVELDWNAYVQALAPRGRLHFVGAAPQVTAALFPLITGMKEISASPVGNPVNIGKMLNFCARHKIEPMVEEYSLSDVNKVFTLIETNKVRFRAVLKL